MNRRDLNRIVRRSVSGFEPPEDLTVSEWADKYRFLSPEASAEPGLWRTSRTPYLKEIMDAVTDPNCERITVKSSSQLGKSEFENNVLGYIMDQDPGSTLFIQPTLDDARKFSRQRIAPMIRDSPKLRKKVREVRQGRDNTATVLQKSFPGGMLTITGSNAASALASTPVRYVIGDERDRWAISAGDEGDPWGLALARQETFYNRKAIEVSTPTIKGASAIADAYEQGTRESWCHQCPECGRYSRIVFDDIRFKPVSHELNGKMIWDIDGEPEWICPKCGCVIPERIMRDQPQKWIAENPTAYDVRKHRSFQLNAFSSPWTTWKHVILRFLESKDDPEKLKVVYNTLFGELWEDRGDVATEDELMARREDYGYDGQGRPIELPDGVLVLTMGVDTQDNRLEYEVVGHGRWGETWGIQKGIIDGRPDEPQVWERLDALMEKAWRYGDGKALKISLCCVDSGGHFTQDVYEQCRLRWHRRVVAIKGKGGEGVTFVSVPSEVPIRDKRYKVRLYTVGVDAGKARIMDNLKVQEPGARYCHFNSNPDAGYDYTYFEGLLSEHLVLSERSKTNRWVWEKIPGHKRNEPLDCRNYALAALKILNPPWERLEQARAASKQAAKPKRQQRPKRRKMRRESAFDW